MTASTDTDTQDTPNPQYTYARRERGSGNPRSRGMQQVGLCYEFRLSLETQARCQMKVVRAVVVRAPRKFEAVPVDETAFI